MADLATWQKKIQDKRKQTPFRDFVRDICSWYPLSFYKTELGITRYPNTERQGVIIDDRYAIFNNDKEIHSSGDFLQDFSKLYMISEKPRLIFARANENADYTDGCYGAKNCYLCFNVGLDFENSLYTLFGSINCSSVIDSLSITNGCSNIYQSRQIVSSMNVFYSSSILQSNNIRFSSNLMGCSECICCNKLENQSYYIKNVQYTKEEYFRLKEELLHDRESFATLYKQYGSSLENVASPSAVGGGIIASQNIHQGYYVDHVVNAANTVFSVGGTKGSTDMYDSIDVGIDSQDFYAVCQAGTNAQDIYCSIFIAAGSYNFYSMCLDTCSFCIGCIGLQNKSYCIFNKQYTKEERYEEADKIFSQMEESGTLGEFFPATMNPFYFNDTAAYLLDPSFTKEEAVKAGFLWRDQPNKVDIPDWMETVETSDLAEYEGLKEGVWTIDPAILKKVIVDEQGNNYRVVKLEYDFLMKHGLPLPRKHWLERMKDNFSIQF